MFFRNCAMRKDTARVLISILFCAWLFGGTAAAQQAGVDEYTSVGGNSSNGRMFLLNFDPEDASVNQSVQVNTDANLRTGLNSFAFFTNTCGTSRSVDVIVADTNDNALLRYAGGRGNGQAICAGGNCPSRPDGLAVSDGQLLAAVSTGAGGSTPSVWTYIPGCSDGNPVFQRRGGGRLSIGSTRIQRIADTAFVRRGDEHGILQEGDLLVLSSPPMIGRVSRQQLQDLKVGDPLEAEVLVPATFFGKASPAGMSFVPFTSTDDRSSSLLVTLGSGQVLELSFSNGIYNRVGGATTWPSYELAGSQGLFSNPIGVDGGTRGSETYAIVADRTRGRFVRTVLVPGTNGRLAVAQGLGAVRHISTNIEHPQDVAIYPVDEGTVFAQDCVDVVNPSGDTTGCVLLDSIQLHLSQGYRGLLPPSARVRASLQLVDDTRPVGSADELLLNPGQDCDGGTCYYLPANCRGFPVDGGYPQVVYLEIEKNFKISAGHIQQITELAKDLLGLEGECDETGARVYYTETDPQGGVLRDSTFSCQNPSRGVTLSSVAVCADELHLGRKNRLSSGLETAVGHRRQEVNEEITRRLDELKAIVDEELKVLPLFVALGDEVKSYLVGQTNPNSSWPQINYKNASQRVDLAAVAVFDEKELFESCSEAYPACPLDNTYNRLLGKLLALAFYIMETGALEDYMPPWQFCDTGYFSYDVGGVEFPELPDVVCANPPPPPE
jgi:hypothetical protein